MIFFIWKDKDSVQFALKLNESELKGRQLRVMRCDARKAKKQKNKVSFYFYILMGGNSA